MSHYYVSTLSAFLVLLISNFAFHINGEQNDSSLITLRPCCKFQQQFVRGKCEENANSNSTLSGATPFPQELTLDDGTTYKFKFGETLPNCLLNHDTSTTRQLIEVNADAEADFHPDGRLSINGTLYSKNSYCVDQLSPGSSVDGRTSYMASVQLCIPTCSFSKPCARKCCPWDMQLVFNENGTHECARIEGSYLDKLRAIKSDYSKRTYSAEDVDLNHVGIPNCSTIGDKLLQIGLGSVSGTGDINFSFRIVPRYTLVIQNSCLDSAIISRSNESNRGINLVMYCHSELDSKLNTQLSRSLAYVSVSFISVLTSVVIRLFIWEKETVAGYMQLGFLISALLYFGFDIYFFSPVNSRDFFQFEGIGLQYILMTNGCQWLFLSFLSNLVNLSVQLCLSIRNGRKHYPVSCWRDLMPVFISQSVCYGVSLVIVVSAYLMNLPLHIYWTWGLLPLNLGCFLITALTIFERMKTRAVLTQTPFDSIFIKKIFWKLLFLSGFIWAFVVLGFMLLQLAYYNVYTDGCWPIETLLTIAEFFDNVYGIVIFIFTTANRKTWNGIKTKLSKWY